MYKKLLAVAVLAAVGATAVPAVFAQDNIQPADQNALNQPLPNAKGGWYIDLGAGAAMSGISNGYKGTSYAGSLSGGYLFPVSPDLSVGPELGYVYLGHQTPGIGYGNNYRSGGNYVNGRDGEARSRGITFGANLRLNLTPGWYMTLHGGLYDAHGEGLNTITEAPSVVRFNNNLGYYIGVGTGWDISRHWSVGATADYYRVSNGGTGSNNPKTYALDTEVFGVKGEYRF
ncbi:outer membrane protein [Frateuria aurantia]|uniref:Opacity protein n=1 Tax=Frateuria aurantia (strain ATCC 33424 / DSM 6220 / KCTC 2777 / LMG 1558 / NBRC 3245 / NCIMB 13370) TaxID=767434 RepID=H8L3T1_FRAAD|nr:outer membrane beta-barrel protein [Frateuria aurantia]AFC84886.1 hypothetical protein Fraau_0397 [Frateuria aurantia DSM 6220]